jgi:hypothetical protein
MSPTPEDLEVSVTPANAPVDQDVLVRTRLALHGVAELVLAGPQYRRTGTIRLRVGDGGFGTTKEPRLQVVGTELVVGDRRLPLSGTTYADLAEEAGVDVGAPEGLYHDGSGASPQDGIVVDPDAARWIAECLAVGEAALRRLAPDQTPVLWPEHFDVGVTVDEVNYGVSPGDSYHAEPYAYVGPHRPRTGEFWNAPFGAARSMPELGDEDGVLAFFQEGRRKAGTP